jgi:hypothetical protein
MGSVRAASFAIVTVICGAWLVASAGSQSEPKKQAPKTITLSGCVERDYQAADGFTIIDAKDHQRYHLSGLSVRKYLGTPVQVDGGIVVKGVTIKGGLLPNPNVAAQAGAIDPTAAAVAASGGSAPVGAIDTMEFKVKAVRPGAGSCP